MPAAFREERLMTAARGAVLVTGAAGFIGSHVCEALVRRGDRVVGLDNFDPFYSAEIKTRNIGGVERTAAACAGSFTLVRADICDRAAVEGVFGRCGVRGVIHLAARAGVRPSIADPAGYARVNVEGTAVVLESAQRAACGRFVLASSSSVYGNNAKVPFGETDDASGPISPYAATKRACELMAHAFHHLYGVPTACLRFFTAYGPRQRPDLAIARFIDLIDRQQPGEMFGDGSAGRDFTYIDDIVSGVLAAYDRIDGFGWRTWNLGGSSPVTVRELVEVIARVVGKPSTIVPGEPRPGDVERTFADLSRSRDELGYEPSTTLEEGVANQWDWWRSVSRAGAEAKAGR